MEKLHTMFLHFFSFFLVSSSHYTAPTKYFINCGSNTTVNTLDGRKFVGDVTSQSSFKVGDSRDVTTDKPLTTLELYQTARLYRKPSSYEISIDERGTYMVRLHFFPFISSQGTDLSEAVFNVSARANQWDVYDGSMYVPTDTKFLLLSNFSVGKSSSLPVIMEYLLEIADGFLLDFVPENTSFAFVNAIEVFRLPRNYIADYPVCTPLADTNGEFYALRTVHRVNVGGGNVNDSGALWRTWVQDDDYIFPNGGFVKTREATFNSGQESEDIAPSSVYRTCRLVNYSNGSSVTDLTWHFKVKRNTRLLIRLHFFDLVSPPSSNVDLQFNVYVYFKLTLVVKPSKAQKHPAAPFYYDLVVDSETSGYVYISIAPRDDCQEKIAFLNGLEIMESVRDTSEEPVTALEIVKFMLFGVLVLVLTLFFPVCAILICEREVAKSGESYWRGKSLSWIAEKTGHALPLPGINLKWKMPLAEIKAATKNFNSKLLIGTGEFGKVYKGSLQDGKKVAVQRCDSRHRWEIHKFQAEVLVLSKIRHQNLVSLIGYCYDRNEMILVYEFKKNETLRDRLSSQKRNSNFKPSGFSWKQRLEICIASARGLHFLHTCPDGGIIHGNIRSISIFIDDDCVAKVADFGVSESKIDLALNISLFGEKESHFDRGYYRTKQLTEKSDVYGLGIVLLEVLCARPPLNLDSNDELLLGKWGMKWLKKGHVEKIIDPLLVGKVSPNSLKKFTETVEKCLEPELANRPSMEDVCCDLEYALELQQN